MGLGGVDVALRVVERVAFAALSAAVRVQVLPATRDQLVVSHSGEPRDLLAVRACEWFARVAAPRRGLADQPDFVRLDLLLFHDAARSRWNAIGLLRALCCAPSGEAPPQICPFAGVFRDARPPLKPRGKETRLPSSISVLR